MHKATRIALWLAAAFVVIVTTVSVALIFPRTPSGSRSLIFQGFVSLPGKGTIQVLDLFAVYQRALFATNISTGDVYKIALGGENLPSSADILVFGREPAAHAVVVDPISGMAFVTRSGANAIDVFDPSKMRLLRRLAVADDPDAILYDPLHRLIYAGSSDAMIATLIDPAKLKVVGTISLGGSPEFAVFDMKTGLVYQNLASTNALAAVDVTKRAIA